MLVLIDHEKIKMLCQERLITPKELAELAGVDRSTVYNIEQGRHKRVQVNTLRRIAAALDLDPRELRIIERDPITY